MAAVAFYGGASLAGDDLELLGRIRAPVLGSGIMGQRVRERLCAIGRAILRGWSPKYLN